MRSLLSLVFMGCLALTASAQCPGGVCRPQPLPATPPQVMPSFNSVAAQGGCASAVALQTPQFVPMPSPWYPGQWVREHQPVRNLFRRAFCR